MTNATVTTPGPPAPSRSRLSWVVPIFCSLITALGAAYTAYSSYKTQLYIEELKTKNEQQVAKLKADTELQIAKIKTDTEYKINQSESQSKADMLRLASQLEREKERRFETATNESERRASQSKRCAEIKDISGVMSKGIGHIGYNDSGYEGAILDLKDASKKVTLYLDPYAIKAFLATIPENASGSTLEKQYDYYSAVLAAYNAEYRASCSN